MNASTFAAPGFLRNILIIDAISCAACGLLQLLFGASLVELFALPASLLMWTGEFLLVYAAVVSVVAFKLPQPHPIVWTFVIGNFAWAIACAALLLGSWVEPTMLGKAYIVMQAVTVVVLAELQLTCLRRSANNMNPPRVTVDY